MTIPYEKWYGAIATRKSRRVYGTRQINPADLKRLEEHCHDFRPYPEVRSVLVTTNPDLIFKGAVGTYGKIKGATALAAFVGAMEGPQVNEKLGYLGESLILEATSMGLDTCWVGGFFRPEVVAELAHVRPGEQVLAVTPLGYARDSISLEEKIMTGFGRTHRRKPLAELVSGLEEASWPAWVKKALEAARVAPSAVNRQPWRFEVAEDNITVAVDSIKDTYGIAKRLDCGIAMLHLELGAMAGGVSGTWEFLSPPQVARFRCAG